MLKELRVMRGPNMWSANYKKLIVLKLDYSSYIDTISNISEDRFNQELLNLLSNKKIKDNPLLFLTDAISCIAASFQKSICLDSQLLGEKSWYAIFTYEDEKTGVEAAHSACQIIETVLQNKVPLFFNQAQNKINAIYNKSLLGPSTNAIVEAAKRRNIPVKKDAAGYLVLGQGKFQKRISASIVATTSNIAVDIAGNKNRTKKLLEASAIPVPKGLVVTKEESLKEIVEELAYPLVVKPLDGNQGKGITTNIKDFETLTQAFNSAKEFSDAVIIEKYFTGNDYRFLVIDYKLIAVAKRTPAQIIGNGFSSIKELIDKVNSDPKRSEGHGNILTKILIDKSTEQILSRKNLTLESRLKNGEILILKDTANLSTGGTAEDVTDEVHPENIMLAERVAKIIGLDICGIDIITNDVTTPITANGGAVLEVNAAPGLRMHISPSAGKSRNVGDPIVDLLFPKDTKSRVPIVAVTGTNGKTTTTRLMSFIAANQGHNIGFTTTDGVYINDIQIEKGDCTGSQSANLVLQEPWVDFAVLECARGGIIRSGLGFDACDIGIVTNVAADHLGLKDIYTIEDLAKVKKVIPRSVKESGYAILNASDDLVYKMKEGLKCKIGLFSLDIENQHIKSHCKDGGVAITLNSNKEIIIIDGKREIIVEHINNIPITINGKAEFMIENVLPVVLASYLLGFSMDKVKQSLTKFCPSVEQTPGRLNIFKVNNINVMIDYAHNPHGLQALGKLLKQIDTHKIGIITGVGDRRDEDIIDVGKIAAEMYDEVIIRIDDDTRGRKPEEITGLIVSGLKQVNAHLPYHYIPDSKEALEYAINHADNGDYVIISADNALETIEIVKQLELENQ